MTDTTFTNDATADAPATHVDAQPSASRYATAGRLGAERVNLLLERGKLYERDHGLSPGRQRVRQLIELGKRYEAEHGLAEPAPRPRQSRGEVWNEFVRLLGAVVKPAYQPLVAKLAVRLAEGTGPDDGGPDGPTLFDGPAAA